MIRRARLALVFASSSPLASGMAAAPAGTPCVQLTALTIPTVTISATSWMDPVVPPPDTVAYYEGVTTTMGGPAATRDFYRLFMAPGMGHQGTGSIDEAASFSCVSTASRP